MTAAGVSETLLRLRREFDDAFALPIETPSDDRLAYVLVRVGAQIHAVSSIELRQIVRSPPVLAVPSTAPAFLGIAALRGVILGVYDLQAILGGEALAASSGAWMLVCPDRQTALAVDAVIGHVHAARSAVLPIAQALQDAPVRALLDAGPSAYPLIDLPAVMRRLASGRQKA